MSCVNAEDDSDDAAAARSRIAQVYIYVDRMNGLDRSAYIYTGAICIPGTTVFFLFRPRRLDFKFFLLFTDDFRWIGNDV